MIASVGSRTVSAGRAACHAGLCGRPRGGARPEPRPGATDSRSDRERTAAQQATRRQPGIEAVPGDEIALASPARAAAAARAFAAGNGYLSGLIVDRLA
jgi:hypothetical protein